jgi:hypothetical protein
MSAMSAFGTKRTNFIAAVMSAYDPKRTFTSPLLKWRYRVNLVEHLQHDGVGRALAVK